MQFARQTGLPAFGGREHHARDADAAGLPGGERKLLASLLVQHDGRCRGFQQRHALRRRRANLADLKTADRDAQPGKPPPGPRKHGFSGGFAGKCTLIIARGTDVADKLEAVAARFDGDQLEREQPPGPGRRGAEDMGRGVI